MATEENKRGFNFNGQPSVDSLSDASIDEHWLYPYACSPMYADMFMRMLVLICQNPVKGLIQLVIEELKDKEVSPDIMPAIANAYFSEFLRAIPLPPSDSEEPISEEPIDLKVTDANTAACKALRTDLKESGPEKIRLDAAIETDIPDSYFRLLVSVLLDRWLQLDGTDPDYTIHFAYVHVVKRLSDTGILSEDNLGTILKADGYKLDEIDTLQYMRMYLYSDEAALRKFFNITGDTLPRLLTRALKAIGGVADLDEA